MVVLESSRDIDALGSDWLRLSNDWLWDGNFIRLWISRSTLVVHKPYNSFGPREVNTEPVSVPIHQGVNSSHNHQIAAQPISRTVTPRVSRPILARTVSRMVTPNVTRPIVAQGVSQMATPRATGTTVAQPVSRTVAPRAANTVISQPVSRSSAPRTHDLSTVATHSMLASSSSSLTYRPWSSSIPTVLIQTAPLTNGAFHAAEYLCPQEPLLFPAPHSMPFIGQACSSAFQPGVSTSGLVVDDGMRGMLSLRSVGSGVRGILSGQVPSGPIGAMPAQEAQRYGNNQRVDGNP